MAIRADTQLAKAEVYQDIVMVELYKRGIILNPYTSYSYQLTQGENMMGAEIKRDGLWRKTGNFYIETHERHNPTSGFSASGIHRRDNTWLYVIGDEKTFYILPKKTLLEIEYFCDKKETPTSKGFVLPIKMAERYSLFKIETDREVQG